MNQTPEMDEKKTSSPETAPIAATAEHNANFEEISARSSAAENRQA